jgi:nicotinamide-nucleotide amidase
MASGTLDHCAADLAVAVTGVAGPGGGTPLKPVGLVHCAVARRGGPVVHEVLRLGDIGREEIRLATVATAIEMLYALAVPAP